MHFSSPAHVLHAHPSHTSWLYHWNNAVQVIKLLIMQSSPVSRYLVSICPELLPQLPISRHPIAYALPLTWQTVSDPHNTTVNVTQTLVAVTTYRFSPTSYKYLASVTRPILFLLKQLSLRTKRVQQFLTVPAARWWRSLACVQSTTRSWNSVLTFARTWQRTQAASRKFQHLDFDTRVCTSCTRVPALPPRSIEKCEDKISRLCK